MYSNTLSYDTNYTTSVNDDLSDIFQPFATGGTKVTATGHRDISGNDLSLIFMKKRTDYVAFPISPSATSYAKDQVQTASMWGQYVILAWNGFQGTSGFYYSSNFGETFTKSLTTGTTTEFGRYSAIWRNYAFVSSSNYLWRSTDYGVTWTVVGSNNFASTSAIAILNNMVITSSGSILYVSNDYGVSWVPLGGTNPTGGFSGVTITRNPSSSTTFTAVICKSGAIGPPITLGTSYNCYNFTGTANDVFIINTTPASTAFKIVRSSERVCVCGGPGGISYSLDYGNTWVPSNITNNILGISFSNNIGLAIPLPESANYYISRDYGKNWTVYTLNLSTSCFVYSPCVYNGHGYMTQTVNPTLASNTNYTVYGFIS